MENNSPFLLFRVTSHEVNSPKLLQALSFCKEQFLDRAFEVGSEGLLIAHLEPMCVVQFVSVIIDLGHHHMENANRLSVMSKLWQGKQSSIYENLSIAPTVHIDDSPHRLIVVKKNRFAPWFCPNFKIVT